MTTTIVNSSTGLLSALKSAQAGDVIQLAAGTYAPVTIQDMHFTGMVTITSQDPSAVATLTGLNVKGSENIAFKGLEFYVDPAKLYNPFQVNGSSHISFDHLNVHGTLDGDPGNDISAMLIRGSTDVKVTNSEFQQLQHGISHLDSSYVTISNNNFHDIRTDGVRGGGTSHITVSNNYFTNFSPADYDHPDAIQFWTTNTKASATDIVVSGNVVLRGSGAATQGIFFRDQVGTLPYQNVTIKDNLVVGGMYNGIVVGHSNNVTVAGNVVAGLPDQDSWINYQSSANLTVTGNTATVFSDGTTNTATPAGNTLIDSPLDGGKAISEAWYAAHTTSGTLTTFTALSTSSTSVLGSTSLTLAIYDAAADAAYQAIEAERVKMMTFNGTSSADRLYADQSHDSLLNGFDGNDMLSSGGIGHNTMIGGAGDDIYYVRSGHDVVVEDAGAGNDLVVASVNYTLTANVEQLRMATGATYGAGNALANKITGTTAGDTILGLGGNDALLGLDGDDKISGGDGNDALTGGLGNDMLNGDAGDDKLGGSEGDDLLSGGYGNDALTGGTGGDVLNGDAGNDKLSGNEDNDTVSGGAGADTIEGGAGVDVLTGGTGGDLFYFRNGDLTNTPDRIVDFHASEGDHISVAMIDANTGLTGDQKFNFIGTQHFHKVAGEIRYDVSGGECHLYMDVNGDGASDMQLIVAGTTSLTKADFLL